MRRKISLYIADTRVDLDDQSLVLFNYTMEDMTNPAIVRNSFSQQVTLKGTPTNNKLFGNIYRSDRQTQYGELYSGVYFDPTRKTPFKIYNELGEILESGYCKLDKFTKDKEYTITLYGGLGAFFYALSYDNDGNKRTLADLKYLADGESATELDFTINKSAVFNAWNALASGARSGSLDKLRHFDNQYEDATGTSHSSAGNQFDVFDTENIGEVLLTGISSADFPLAICIGQYGAVLGTIGTGSQTYSDYRATLPSGTYTIRVNGNASVAPDAKYPATMWDVINFAPCYNGYPSGSFDANKALINADNAGLTIPSGASTTGGYVLANLPNKYTEWETKDLRSYLQRPVIKFSRIIDAICKPANNGGYSVELDSAFFNANNPYYAKTWMTLPLIQSLNLQETGGKGTIAPSGVNIPVPNGGSVTTLYNVHIELNPALFLETIGDAPLYMDTKDNTTNSGLYMNYITYTANACDLQGNVIATQVLNLSTRQSPEFEEDFPVIDVIGNFDRDGNWIGNSAIFNFTNYGISYVEVTQQINAKSWGSAPAHSPSSMMVWSNRNNYSSSVNVSVYGREYPAGRTKYKYTTSATARTGAQITKSLLLSSDKTPADYLLSFCKMFGLVFKFDKTENKVSIMQRTSFYQNEVKDLTKRMNLSQTPSFLPFAFDSKWYNFGAEYEEGEFAQYYEKVYGRRYGLQKVNTGFGFNADSKEILDGVLFSGGCEVLESSKNFVDITRGTSKIPSVFQDSGATYSVNKTGGETEEVSVPSVPDTATKTWINQSNITFDLFPKVQFHNDDNAGYEERDTLLFFDSMKSLTGVSERYAVTDDNMVMMALNDNTPCWLLDYQLIDGTAKVVSLPLFSRYLKDSNNKVTKSLDLGTPFEVSIPDVTFQDGSSVYDQYWKKYISDRYDDDSKVMTCKVNLSGLQVNEDLFRSFYFYDGAIWALNKITNHSLTTYDDTECEFVKVQDIQNYIS